ncbi:THUMP domain-containing class I SAM-dependent RNA methyltransferase [Geoalkalibacter sp.]|uniref:THUMP domain-containing class I SAM-dependent RNA methyltransferase n=1 Tax=Geoalkalibacter sp. TaxID=3041440 RepID=UPI00272EAA17|nr:class I SAM-dependent RNA methyltransferase [Geoalkalibacter sp.]
MAQSPFDLYAVTAPGCEAACLAELQALNLPAQLEAGGLRFVGELADVYRANLWLRSASRVLVRFAEIRATSFPELYQKCLRLPWGRFIRPQTALDVRVHCRRSRLMHTGRIAETLTAAVDRALGRETSLNTELPRQLVLVRFEDDRAQLSIDSSGELLHRRGYRLEQGAAPLRETLAAALLHAVDWRPGLPLWDPMCGSGTLLIEAALLARNLAPGRHRSFAFEGWPHFRAGRWRLLLDQAAAGEHPVNGTNFFGSELDPRLVQVAGRNAERAGVAALLDVRAGDFRRLSPPSDAGPGIVLCNPPYGERLGEQRPLLDFFREFGVFLRRNAPGWRGGFLASDPRLAQATGLRPRPGPTFAHGGLTVTLYLFELP